MKSAYYCGSVRHARRAPAHAFEQPVRMFWIELDEIGALERAGILSPRKRALRCFRREDHLGDARRPLDACVRDLVEMQSGTRPLGPIALLTQLRQLGVLFDPVSFYYCQSQDRERLEAVVADVTNTPWGERHAYVLVPERAAETSRELRASASKVFHVSPFLGMEYAHRFRFALPDGSRGSLRAEIENVGGAGVEFAASLRLERRSWDEARRLRCAPLATLVGIYREALALALRGAPFHSHPDGRPEAAHLRGREEVVE